MGIANQKPQGPPNPNNRQSYASQNPATSPSITPTQATMNNAWQKIPTAVRTNNTRHTYQASVQNARGGGNPNALAAQMGNMSIHGGHRNGIAALTPLAPAPQATAPQASQQYYNVSYAPNAPTVAPNAAGTTYRNGVRTQACVVSGRTRRHFHKGDIISLPFHTPNTNPNATLPDDRIQLTCEGPVYSKRRMVVVLWIYMNDMFCVPLYSFSGRGLAAKPQHIKKEYVCVKNVGAGPFVNAGIYPEVEVSCRKALTEETTVHLTGGLKVACNEDIDVVGRMTERGHMRLTALFTTLQDAAKKDPW